MKHRIALNFASFLLFGFLLAAANAGAQTVGYRQTDLASSHPNVANNITPGLVNPWGLAFLSGQPFFIADNKAGHVSSLDATGFSVSPGAFIVPNPAQTGLGVPTGIIADQNSFFGSPSLIMPFIVVTEEGAIFTWGPDAQGNIPQQATLMRSRSAAVYKGVAILDSLLTAPALAVTDFQGGFIETFLPGFVAVALPGSFRDPTLPAGYAPFGIQVIGRQVFVTYALQDAAKHDPVFGAGNGVVSIFDMDGNFVRRFATGGALNAPWGVTQATANFGPFSNDILIGNVGDGTINAFDPASGRFVGAVLDGDGNNIAELGLHALAFRADGFGNPDTLYFTSELTNEQDGLFGAITTGLVSVIRVSVPGTTASTSVTITANVAAGPGNQGAPTGTVTFLDGSTQLGTASLVNGSATLDVIFSGKGIHALVAQYSGDGVFLASSERIPLQVTGLTTLVTLVAPANAAPSSTVTLSATVNSAGGVPTGQVTFLDGSTSIGIAPLDAAGVATLRSNTLAVGSHSLTASYSGDEKFSSSNSAPVTINIANADFSLGAAPGSATVVAGQSTQFMLTVTPSGGFANSVTFSCSPINGITCVFSPGTVTLASGAATTTLTVTTSASVPQFSSSIINLSGPTFVLAALALYGFALRRGKRLQSRRHFLFPAAATLIFLALSLALGGCGGYAGTAPSPSNRGTASVTVTAQSGAVSHTTTVAVTVQ